MCLHRRQTELINKVKKESAGIKCQCELCKEHYNINGFVEQTADRIKKLSKERKCGVSNANVNYAKKIILLMALGVMSTFFWGPRKFENLHPPPH